MIRDGDDTLDVRACRAWVMTVDPVTLYVAPVAS